MMQVVDKIKSLSFAELKAQPNNYRNFGSIKTFEEVSPEITAFVGNSEDVIQAFNNFISNNPILSYLQKIIAEECRFETFLIGSTLTSNLIKIIKDRTAEVSGDIDLLISIQDAEKLKKRLNKDGWSSKTNKFGTTKLLKKINGNVFEIDLMTFENIGLPHINKRIDFNWYKSDQYENLLNKHFEFSPFDIQAIVYGFFSAKVLGEIGCKAVLNEKIEVHHLPSVMYLERNVCKLSRKRQLEIKYDSNGIR